MTPARPSSLARQWAVGPVEAPPHPDAEHGLTLDRVRIDWLDPLLVHPALDARGRRIGAFLGHAVDWRRGVVPHGTVRLDEAFSPDDADGFVERQVFRHTGSWAFVLDADGVSRLYLDADGTLSAVYDPETGRAGATAAMLLDDDAYAARFDGELHRHLDILREGWFPAGLTAHRGISRLLVNHHLDLSDGTARRHWPTGPIPETAEPEAACLQVAEQTRRTVEALRADGTLAAALTGGNESRFLLAACRPFAGELDFVTVDGPETRRDVDLARRLAARFGLNHRTLALRRADAAGQARWHAQTGHCMGGSNMVSHPTVLPLAEVDHFVVGFGGEIGRGFFWRPQDTADMAVTAETIERRMGMAPHPRVRAAVAAWLADAPEGDAFQTLDLAYLELRMGCWGYALSYVLPEVSHVSPMVGRTAYESMLSLPPAWRRENRLILDTIGLLWPDLLEVPINRYGNFRDGLSLLTRALRNPHLVAKKLRKLRG